MCLPSGTKSVNAGVNKAVVLDCPFDVAKGEKSLGATVAICPSLTPRIERGPVNRLKLAGSACKTATF
ncbi:hypothetical protein GCM10007984_16310 [Shewanella putrefaciens]|nr:hypothetical protein GCM10007984_16310 [Shewanella putrefaciens]